VIDDVKDGIHPRSRIMLPHRYYKLEILHYTIPRDRHDYAINE
jgi:hypothetical protein